MTFRPLIKLNNQTEIYLPNDYSYSAGESAKIKKFLPKILAFSGVDSMSDSQKEREQALKQKLKVRSVQQGEKKLSFYKEDELVMKIWENVPICVNIPFNNRQNPQDEKQELQSKLEKYVSESLNFYDETGTLLERNHKIQDLSKVSVSFSPIEIASQTFDNSYRKLRIVLSLGLVLVKRESYGVEALVQTLRDDVVNSIKIMVKNQLCIRIVRGVCRNERVLVLQSFVGKLDDVANQQKKLDQLLGKVKPVKKQAQKISNIQSVEINTDNSMHNNNRKDLSNRQLMLILLGLFFIYLFLKINPIQKLLAQNL